ncbi:MAG: MYB domain-containing protein [Cytophagales bacterium]|nr:MYB domain-containing protein [Cytophagales bacterium]
MRFRQSIFLYLIVPVLVSILVSGCVRKKKKVNRLQKFNSELWIRDKGGCNGDRSHLKNHFLSLKHNMRGLKTGEVEDLLGMPDAQELYERGQRYHIYFIDPGPKCPSPKENPQALFVRFTAVGIANEFTIRPLQPRSPHGS